MLPPDLHTAEDQTLLAVRAALTADGDGRWTVDWRFEGLRLLPPVLRLFENLSQQHSVLLLVSDAGGAALARREAAGLAPQVVDLRQLQQNQCLQPSSGVLLALAPTAADYDGFEAVCQAHAGAVVMINGRLEDAAIGIGSVARERRRGFLASWNCAYALLPLTGGALRRALPQDWELYRRDPDGYRLLVRYDQRPDQETIAAALSGDGGSGVSGGLRALDGLLQQLGG